MSFGDVGRELGRRWQVNNTFFFKTIAFFVVVVAVVFNDANFEQRLSQNDPIRRECEAKAAQDKRRYDREKTLYDAAHSSD
jgi:hypothetical protein